MNFMRMKYFILDFDILLNNSKIIDKIIIFIEFFIRFITDLYSSIKEPKNMHVL